MRTVVQGAAANRSIQVKAIDDAEIGRNRPADVFIAALAVSAGLQTLQGIGVGAGRIVVGTVGVLDLVDGRHTVALLDDPLRPIGVIPGDIPGILGRGTDRKAAVHLVAQVQASVVTVITVIRALEQAVLVYKAQGCHIGEILGSSGDGEIVALLGG